MTPNPQDLVEVIAPDIIRETAQRRNFEAPEYKYCFDRVKLSTIMTLIAVSVFIIFISTLFEIIGGFVAFNASIAGRLLMVVIAVMMLKCA